MIRVKRAYEDPGRGDGRRLLVERLWPRGLKKEALRLFDWSKDLAPSAELRQWFQHDPDKWDEFRRRYFAELDSRPEAIERVLKLAREGNVTLVFSAHDTRHNNAVALKEYLDARAGSRSRAGGGAA